MVLPTPPLPEPTATIFETPGKATGEGIACPCAIRILLTQVYRRCASLRRGRLRRDGCSHHPCQHLMKLAYPIRQRRRPWLQNAGGLDLVDMAVAYGADRIPPRPRADLPLVHLSPAPGGKDHLGVALYDFRGIDDAVLRFPAPAQFGKNHLAPAISTSSSTHAMPLISGSFHSSK